MNAIVMKCLIRDGVQDCLETRVDVVRTSLRQLQEKLSQVIYYLF